MAFIRLAIASIAVVAWAINLTGQEDKRTPLPEHKETNECSVTMVFPYVGQQGTTPQADSSQAEPPHWYTLPEWWLCILGVLTLFILGWQANESRRAAEAARDSIRLQELALRQWVDLIHWNVKKPQSSAVRIKVDLMNRTASPMKIIQGFVRVGDSPSENIGRETFLSPNVPYIIDFFYGISGEQERQFEAGSLSFPVSGTFTHLDQIGRGIVEQSFRGLLRCGYWGTTVEWYIHPNPEIRKTDGET